MKKLIRLLSYLIYTLLVVEICLRVGSHFLHRTSLLDIRRFRPDPYLTWKLNPGYRGSFFGYQYVTVNRNGCLGRNLAPKTPGLVRVVALGGSVSFGMGVPQMDQNVCSDLEKLLNANASGLHYEVVNAGVPGYSSWNGRQYVEHYLADLQPDILLVSFGWNDSVRDRIADNAPPGSGVKKFDNNPNPWLGWTLIGHAVAPAYCRIVSVVSGYLTPPLPMETPRVSVDDFKANLAAIDGWCRQCGVKLLFWNEPSPDSLFPGNEHLAHHRPYLEAMREAGLSLGVPVANLDSAFAGADPRTWLAYPQVDFIHLGFQGQADAAKLIATTLAQAGYLNP